MSFLKLGAVAYGGPVMIGQIKETVAKIRLCERGRISSRSSPLPIDPACDRGPGGTLYWVSTRPTKLSESGTSFFSRPQ
jgi:hypothetical protein